MVEVHYRVKGNNTIRRMCFVIVFIIHTSLKRENKMSNNERFIHKNTQSKSSLSYLTGLRKKYGFTGIFNTHLMVILSTKDLTTLEKNILLYIIKQTIGWNRLETYFDTETYSLMLGISKGRVLTSLNRLEASGIIERSKKRNHNKSKGILWIQPDHEKWNIEYNKDLVESVIAENHRTKKPCNTQTPKDGNEIMTKDSAEELLKDMK